jgi:nucleotide-binding universal stress UspA family protein
MFTNILVPIDRYSVESKDFPRLRTLALKDDAKVTFVHVSDPLPPAVYVQNGYGGDYISVPDHKRACESYAKRLFKRAEIALGPLIKTETLHVFNSDVSDGIIQAASNLNTDAIFMISHKRTGVGGLFFGSETRDVMRKAEAPILVV